MRVFSENGKISPRQLRCLLTLDFFGKGALLLPALAEGLTSREFISCLLIVFLLVFAYGRLVERIGRDCGGNFKAYAEQKMGEVPGKDMPGESLIKEWQKVQEIRSCEIEKCYRICNKKKKLDRWPVKKRRLPVRPVGGSR